MATTALNTYIPLKLGNMATYLGWTSVSTEVDLIIEDTLGILGLASESASNDSVALKAVAMFIAWEAVLDSISTDYNFSADRAKYDRSQMHEMASLNYMNAKKKALPYMPVSQIHVGTVTYSEDPYEEDELDDFTDRSLV